MWRNDCDILWPWITEITKSLQTLLSLNWLLNTVKLNNEEHEFTCMWTIARFPSKHASPLQVTVAAPRGGVGRRKCPFPIYGLPPLPWPPHLGSTEKYGLISFRTIIATVFQGTRTIPSGTFNCAFHSTPHRLLPDSFLMLCPWYRPALELIINSQTGDP